MSIEIDHFFICASHGAPEAEGLIAFGLTEGTPNQHPGQGTANRRFFFRNIMLELLWVDDAAEAQGESVRRTQLWERWSTRNIQASPFGICLRPTDRENAAAPFPAWEYRPPYLPGTRVVHLAADTPLSEPMWFYLGFGRRPDSAPIEKRQPLDHPIGFQEVTGVRVTNPAPQPLSTTGRAVMETGLVSVQPGKEHLLEIVFDGYQKGCRADFRPHLPLVFRW